MQSKISLKQILLALSALSLALIFYFTSKSPVQNSPVQFAKNTTAFYGQEKINSGLPVRFKIPKIDIDTSVEHVGLTSGGAMDIPKGPDDVAWFDLGARPGDVGSAIISGHYGWKNGIPAVFDNLHKLQKGDKVYVEDEKGKTNAFVVREFRTYSQNDYAPEVFSLMDRKAHLNLVTCEGVWDKAQKSYSNRFVVFTDKEIK